MHKRGKKVRLWWDSKSQPPNNYFSTTRSPTRYPLRHGAAYNCALIVLKPPNPINICCLKNQSIIQHLGVVKQVVMNIIIGWHFLYMKNWLIVVVLFFKILVPFFTQFAGNSMYHNKTKIQSESELSVDTSHVKTNSLPE